MIIHNPVITGSLQVNGSSVASIESLDSTSGSVAALNNATSSYALISEISGSTTALSSSLEGRISDNETSVSSLNSASSSYALQNSISGSFTSVSESLADRIATAESELGNTLISGSAQIASEISGSFTSTSSSLASELLKNTTDTLTGDLTVTGTITAQDLHVQEVTSSIVYSSGSNIFGTDSSNTQILYGNVGIGTAYPSSSLHIYDSTASRLTVGTYGAPHYTQSGMAYQVIRATTDNAARALLELHSGNQGTKGIVQAVGANNTVYFGALTNSNASYGNDVEAFYFNTAGNVGLGTTNNTHKLVVKGTSAALTSDSDMRFYIDRSAATDLGSIIFTTGGASVSNGWAEIGQTDTNGDLYFKANASAGSYDTRMVIKGSNGRVGIGTTSPVRLFHVYENSDVWHTTIGGGSGELRIGGQTSNGAVIQSQTPAGGFRDLYLQRDGGSIGIGTSGALAPLHLHTGAAGTGATGSFQDNTALGIESTSDQYIEMLTSGGSSGQMQGILFSDNGRNAFVGYKEYTGGVANTKGEALHLAFYDYSASDSNNGIYFGTSNTPWLGVSTTHMFIKGNGNVGIGTTAPGDKLDVRGDVLVDYGIYFKRGSTDYSTYIRSANYPSQGYTSTTERYWVELGSKGGTHIVLNTDGGAGSALNSYDHFTIWQGAVDGDKLMAVDNVGKGYYAGSVGIGTTAPGAKLTVAATATGDTRNLLLSNLNDTNADSVSIGFSMLANNTYVKSGIMFERTLNGGRGNLYLMTNSATDGTNVSKSDARLTVQHDGKIGINTTSPSYQLDVNGNVKLDYSLLGRSMRSTDRGELILNATGTNDVSEVLFGYGNGYTENNLRWGISDRGVSDGTLRFYIGPALSGWAEVMVLKASGKEAHFYGSVGIGTTSPDRKLHIVSNLEEVIRIDASGNSGAIHFRENGAIRGLIGFSNGTTIYTGADDQDIVLRSEQKLHLISNSSNNGITISAGNVGIGTTSPSGKLNIYSTGTANAPALAIDNTSSSAFVHSLEAFSGNMTAGQHNIMVVGKAGSTKNSGYIGYTWAGAGSDSNFVTLGHWGADDLLRVYGNGDVRSGTNYKSAGWNWVTTPYHYYAATTSTSMVTVDVNSDFTVNGNSAIPSYAKALYVTYYYHISGYSVGTAGQGDHANDIWGPDYSVTTTSWSFTTSGNYKWGAAVFMHDGDASENGDMGYYGVWYPGAIIPVNSNGNIYGYLGHGHSGGTHYHHMYVWGYAL